MKADSLFAQRVVVGVALIIFGAATLFYFYMEHIQVEDRERERLKTQAHVIEENINQNLISLDHVLLDIQKKDLSQFTKNELDIYLQSIADAMPGVRTMSMMDAQGSVTASNRKEIYGRNFSQRQYFQDVRANPDPKKSYVSRPFLTALGIYSINVSRMLSDSEGRFAGIVTATLDPAYFSPLLDSVRYAPDMNVVLVHWDGDVFQRAPAPQPATSEMPSQDPFLDAHRKSGQDYTFRALIKDKAGVEHMQIQQTIRPATLAVDKPLVVEINRDIDKVYAQWKNRVFVFGLGYLAIFFLSTGGLLIFQRNQREIERREQAALKALEASERLMKTVTDNLPALVAYWGRDYRCRFANGAYVEWFGRDPQGLIGTRIQDLLGEELFRKNEPYIEGALRGQSQRFERILTKADGSSGFTWAQYIPDLDADGHVQGFFVLVSDVTPLKQAQLALAESEWKLRTIIETEPECVTILSGDGKVQQINRAGWQMIAAPSEKSAIGSRFIDWVDMQWRDEFNALLEAAKHGDSRMLAFKLINMRGISLWLECYSAPMRERTGSFSGTLCVMRDITDRKKAEEELERLAQTDVLTGIANRRHFMALANQELERSQRYGSPLTVLMMDIDHFKKINDGYGHKCGDAVIRKFAELCRANMRRSDTVGRIGGEEFAVILPETLQEQGMEVAELLRKKASLAEIHTDDGRLVRFTVSIGVAGYAGEIKDFEALLAQADEALYCAKHQGRNRVRRYQEDMPIA